MALNSLFKAVFTRGKLDDFEKRHYAKENIIRTDFILENTFSYLVCNHYKFDAISNMNKREKDIFENIKKTLHAFRESYPIKNMCEEIDVINEDTVDSILLDVSNELFSEGITWSRIIAFFVFVGELTITCIEKKLLNSIVDVMYECFSRLVKEKLESWIENHDGWEGLSISIQTENEFKTSNPSWFNNLLSGEMISSVFSKENLMIFSIFIFLQLYIFKDY